MPLRLGHSTADCAQGLQRRHCGIVRENAGHVKRPETTGYLTDMETSPAKAAMMGTLSTVNHEGARHNGETVILRTKASGSSGLLSRHLFHQPRQAYSLRFLHEEWLTGA